MRSTFHEKFEHDVKVKINTKIIALHVDKISEGKSAEINWRHGRLEMTEEGDDIRPMETTTNKS
ncbi:hypothetical protein L484_011618 [Morus notabilis]|uniref:Uncharacterized protein n=1 Tax=Morus notabilis TaxID=981085 RepID=W9RKS5_9ROSA|nr:hypothetical protein L484_011618 [Morus notabilis]